MAIIVKFVNREFLVKRAITQPHGIIQNIHIVFYFAQICNMHSNLLDDYKNGTMRNLKRTFIQIYNGFHFHYSHMFPR